MVVTPLSLIGGKMTEGVWVKMYPDDVNMHVSGTGVTDIVRITQTEYNDLDPIDALTLYVIVG